MGARLSKGKTAGDLAFGGGSGGVLVYIFKNWVPDPKYQGLLLYLAPTFSVVCLAAYSWLGEKWEQRKNAALERRRRAEEESERHQLIAAADTAIAKATEELALAESDPNTKAQTKTYWRNHIQELKEARQKILTATFIKRR